MEPLREDFRIRMRTSAHHFQVVKDKLIDFMRDEDELFDALFKVCAS